MPLSREHLYEALVESGGVTEKQFNTAAQSRDAAKLGIDGILVNQGALKDEEVGQLVADSLSLPYVNLRQQDIDEQTLHLLPESFSRSQHVLPFLKTENEVKIASDDPQNAVLRALLEKYLRTDVIVSYATPRDIESSLYLFQKDPAVVIKAIADRAPENPEEDTAVIEIVDAIIDFAYQHRTSDIHLEPEDEYTVVRFRVDGVLHDIVDLEKKFHDPIITRLKVLAKLATDERRAAQDGKISHKSAWGDNIEIRLSIVPTTNGEKAVMRLLSEKAREFSLTDLGLNEGDFARFNEAIEKPWGMILVTGPTGSGKTTTLYAAIKILNTRDVNIAAIEDPVEYDIEGVNQIQVNPKTNLTFAKGLRSIVRQDPDIIMVGEIRDPETADIATNAALTGHLVVSTLHTNDASASFARLKDMDVEGFLISSTVVSVLAQRLVRKICLRCIESHEFTKQEVKLIGQYPQVQTAFLKLAGKKSLGSVRTFKGKGCPVCNHTGYTGRTGVFEVLNMTDTIRAFIMADKPADEIRALAVKEGMTTMLHDGLQKVLTGVTTLEEVLRVSQEG